LPVIICDLIVNGAFQGRLDREHLSAEEVYHIYFPIWNSEINTYCLIIADLSEKKLLYIDPRVNSSLPLDTREVIENVEFDLNRNYGIVRDILARFDQ